MTNTSTEDVMSGIHILIKKEKERMIKLNVGKVERYPSILKSVFVQNGQYGDEIIFAWDITGHPTISYISESYGIWSERYGEEAFERLSKAVKFLTGEQLINGSDFDESKIIGKKALLSIAYNKNNNPYISSRKHIEGEN